MSNRNKGKTAAEVKKAAAEAARAFAEGGTGIVDVGDSAADNSAASVPDGIVSGSVGGSSNVAASVLSAAAPIPVAVAPPIAAAALEIVPTVPANENQGVLVTGDKVTHIMDSIEEVEILEYMQRRNPRLITGVSNQLGGSGSQSSNRIGGRVNRDMPVNPVVVDPYMLFFQQSIVAAITQQSDNLTAVTQIMKLQMQIELDRLYTLSPDASNAEFAATCIPDTDELRAKLMAIGKSEAEVNHFYKKERDRSRIIRELADSRREQMTIEEVHNQRRDTASSASAAVGHYMRQPSAVPNPVSVPQSPASSSSRIGQQRRDNIPPRPGSVVHIHASSQNTQSNLPAPTDAAVSTEVTNMIATGLTAMELEQRRLAFAKYGMSEQVDDSVHTKSANRSYKRTRKLGRVDLNNPYSDEDSDGSSTGNISVSAQKKSHVMMLSRLNVRTERPDDVQHLARDTDIDLWIMKFLVLARLGKWNNSHQVNLIKLCAMPLPEISHGIEHLQEEYRRLHNPRPNVEIPAPTILDYLKEKLAPSKRVIAYKLAQLNSLRQEKFETVRSYYERFRRAVTDARAEDTKDVTLMGIWTNGLLPHYKTVIDLNVGHEPSETFLAQFNMVEMIETLSNKGSYAGTLFANPASMTAVPDTGARLSDEKKNDVYISMIAQQEAEAKRQIMKQAQTPLAAVTPAATAIIPEIVGPIWNDTIVELANSRMVQDAMLRDIEAFKNNVNDRLNNNNNNNNNDTNMNMNNNHNNNNNRNNFRRQRWNPNYQRNYNNNYNNNNRNNGNNRSNQNNNNVITDNNNNQARPAQNSNTTNNNNNNQRFGNNRNMANVKCYYCDKVGHIAPSCPLKKYEDEQKANGNYRPVNSSNPTAPRINMVKHKSVPRRGPVVNDIHRSVVSTDSVDELVITGLIGSTIVSRMLLDTGAIKSLISNKLFQLLSPADYTIIKRITEEDELYDASNNSLPIIAKIHVMFKLIAEGMECGDYVTLYVCDSLAYSAIIGRDLIDRFIATIDITNRQITLLPEDEIILPVTLVGSIVIPPGTHRTATAYVDLDQLPFGLSAAPFYPELTNANDEEIPLSIEPFSITTDETVGQYLVFRITLFNPTGTAYTLSKNRHLGSIVGYRTPVGENVDLLETMQHDPMLHISQPQRIICTINEINVDSRENYVEAENDTDTQYGLSQIHINQDLSERQQLEVESLVHKFKDIFTARNSCVTSAIGANHSIDTGEHPPIRQQNYRVSPHIMDKIAERIQELEASTVIQPSQSPWCNPICPVVKTDGSIRLCIDYRKLNEITKKDSYPLPRIDEILESLKDEKFFGLIDLKSGYHQIPLNPADRAKTAFAFNNELWEFTVMPEGVTNGPPTFQRYMHTVLKPFIGKFVRVYIDDILVYGRTWEEFIQNLRKIFARLREVNLRVSSQKTLLGYQEIKVLGHIVGNGQLKPNPVKVSAITHFPAPTNQRELRAFLGLVNYYRRYIPDMATVAVPLYQLLKKKIAWHWTTTHEEAFNKLKKILLSDPVLKCPDFDKEFILETDASTSGLGAILSQYHDAYQYPVSYISRSLTPAEKNYSITELECLAIVWAVGEFAIYLAYRPFRLFTDHQALSWLKQKVSPNKRLARWSLILAEFNFTISYRKGSEMKHVDALSRYPASIINMIHARETHTPLFIRPTTFTLRAPQSYRSILQIVKKPRGTKKRARITPHKVYEVQTIVGKEERNGEIWYNVKWKGFPSSTNTWEPVTKLTNAMDVVRAYEAALIQPLVPPIPQLPTPPTTVPAITPISAAAASEAATPAIIEEAEEVRPTVPIIDNNYIITSEQEHKIVEIIRAQLKDLALKPIIDYLKRNEVPMSYTPEQRMKLSKSCNNYIINDTNDGLYYLYNSKTSRNYNPFKTIRRLVIPQAFHAYILSHYHDSVFGGHLGIEKTYLRINAYFWWNNLYKSVETYVRTCNICQIVKTGHVPGTPLVGSNPIPPHPFHTLGVDFFGPITPPCYVDDIAYKYLLIFIDSFSKWAIVVPTTTTDSDTVAKALLEKVICIYGAPMRLLSDRGTGFLSKIMYELYAYLQIKKVNTSAYHPQTNGMVERFNHTIINMLRSTTNMRSGKWMEYLAPLVFAYNTAVHTTTMESPYFIVFGRQPITLGPDNLSNTELSFDGPLDYIDVIKERCAFAHKLVLEHLKEAQEEYLSVNAAKSTDPTYKEGDLVWCRKYLKPTTGLTHKFVIPWDGPYVITKVFNSINYEIQLHRKSHAKPLVVHCSRLRPVKYREGTMKPLAIEECEIINRPTKSQLDFSEEPIMIDDDSETDATQAPASTSEVNSSETVPTAPRNNTTTRNTRHSTRASSSRFTATSIGTADNQPLYNASDSEH